MTRNQKAFTLVEIMIVVAIIGILIAIAVPSFLRSREIARRNACQENLTKIDSSKQQYAMENNMSATDATDIGFSVLVGVSAYLRKTPTCPADGTYTTGPLSDDPACSLSTGNGGFEHTFPQSDGS